MHDPASLICFWLYYYSVTDSSVQYGTDFFFLIFIFFSFFFVIEIPAHNTAHCMHFQYRFNAECDF